MNKQATKHLSQAASFVAKGEEFYRKAAEEIVAAQKADPALSNREVGEYVGDVVRGKPYGKDWVARLVRWSTTDAAPSPFGEEAEPGMRERVDRGATKRILTEAPLEQVEKIVASLPQEAIAKVAKAVSRNYEQRGEEAKRKSDRDFRDAVGDDVADDLNEEQRLRDAETKAFEARRSLRDMLALLNDSNLDAMRDSWREDFLKTIDEGITMYDLARSLLTGTLDEDIARFLAEV